MTIQDDDDFIHALAEKFEIIEHDKLNIDEKDKLNDIFLKLRTYISKKIPSINDSKNPRKKEQNIKENFKSLLTFFKIENTLYLTIEDLSLFLLKLKYPLDNYDKVLMMKHLDPEEHGHISIEEFKL